MTITIHRAPTGAGYRLETCLLVEAPRDEVFAFFADAFQLETLTPPWLHFSVLTPPPLCLRQGTRIDYRLRLHGLPIRWQSEIRVWEPPGRFVDAQLRGPYRHWHHLHTFDEVAGGTLVSDIVDYAVPCSLLLHPLLVRRDLQRIFAFRRESLARVFTAVPRP